MLTRCLYNRGFKTYVGGLGFMVRNVFFIVYGCFFGLVLNSSSLAVDMVPSGAAAPIQISHKLTPSMSNYRYTFVWRDSKRQVFKNEFNLHSRDVKTGSNEFKKVGPKDDIEIARRLQVVADRIGKKVNAQILVSEDGGQFTLNMKGPDVSAEAFQSVFDHLQVEQSNIINEYLKERYYQVELGKDAILIRPDYQSLVKRYKPIGQIIGRSLKATGPKDQRGLVSHALEFIQSIPYERFANDGADFQTPIGLFTDNKGDCDTKAVALGSILDSWGINYVFLLMPEHLFMGIELPKRSGERSFSYAGRSYILAEPAGIGFPLGVGYPDSIEAFKKGTIEVVGF